uniref:Uncharacterized protein n=1 Tax=Knipowitschia caucasica TaxID=637954 RepID=A0AAV2M0R5_KNICA
MAKVHHSQALSEPPLKPWVSLQKDGTVLCGHCTCKAGLGEPLTELYNPHHRKLSASDLMVKCDDAFINIEVTPEQMGMSTREDSKADV